MVYDVTESSDSLDSGTSPDERHRKPPTDIFKTSVASKKSIKGLGAICDITIDDFSEGEEPWYGESISPNSSPSTRPAFPGSTLVPSRPASAPPWAAQRDASQHSPTCSLTQSPASAHISSGTVSPALSFSLSDSPVAPKRASPQSYSRSFSLNLGAAVTATNSANYPTPRLGTFSIGTPQLKSTSLDLGNRVVHDSPGTVDETKAQVLQPSNCSATHTCSKPRETPAPPASSSEGSATQLEKQVHASTAATPDAPEIPSAIAHNSEQLLELSEEAKQLYATVSCLNDHIDRFRKGLGAAPDPFVDSSSSLQALRSELQDAQAACQALKQSSDHSIGMPLHGSVTGPPEADYNQGDTLTISHPHKCEKSEVTTTERSTSSSSAPCASKTNTEPHSLPPSPIPSTFSRHSTVPVANTAHRSSQGCVRSRPNHPAAAASRSLSPVATTRSPSQLSHESALHIVPSSTLPRHGSGAPAPGAIASHSTRVSHASCSNLTLDTSDSMHMRGPQSPSATFSSLKHLMSDPGVLTRPRPCPPVPPVLHSKAACMHPMRPGARSGKSLSLRKPAVLLPGALRMSPPPSPPLRLPLVTKILTINGSSSSASTSSSGRLAIPLPSPAAKIRPAAANINKHIRTGPGYSGVHDSTATDRSAQAQIARLERQLCEAHTSRRAAQVDAEKQRRLVCDLKQQVADLTGTVSAYRCNSYMPKGPQPYSQRYPASTEQSLPSITGPGSRLNLGDPFDGSWGLKEEKSGGLRMTGRGVRRSVHCVATAPVTCSKLRESEALACGEQLQESDSVKAIKDWYP